MVRARSVVLVAGDGSVAIKHWMAGIFCAALTMSAVAPVAHAKELNCAVPASYARLDEKLPVTASRLKRHLPLVIVAFGSSSTSGVGASSASATYPSQMAHDLQQIFPDSAIRVINNGIADESSTEMDRRFDRDTVDLRPHLVIWQTGSNDILKGTDLDSFRAKTRAGIKKLHEAGIDVLIMEPQYSPRIVARPNAAAYIDALKQIADEEDAPVVHRFEAMEYWLDSGEIDRKQLLSGDSLHMSDASYACLGSLVATEIAQSVASPARLAGSVTTTAGSVAR